MNEILNNRIAEIRKDRDLTQTELAERAGLPQSNISRAESGQSSIEVKCRIADALNLPVPDVFPDMPAITCKRCGKRDFGAHVSTYHDGQGFDLCWKCCEDATFDAQSAIAKRLNYPGLFVTTDDLISIIDLAKRTGFDQDCMPGYRRAAPNRVKNPKEKKITKEEKAAILREKTLAGVGERIKKYLEVMEGHS